MVRKHLCEGCTCQASFRDPDVTALEWAASFAQVFVSEPAMKLIEEATAGK
jgi:hypothetical protein